jgi:DNA-binding transcriptional regulator YiaG
MPIRCSSCHVGTFEPTTVDRVDRSTWMGLSPVDVPHAPGLRCSHCGEVTWEGTTLEAIAEELARQLVADSSPLAPEEVRYLRTYLGLTQAELATQLGVDRTTVARWDKADRPLRHDEALGLRALVALHLLAARPSLATALAARFTTPPPAERTAPYVVSSDVFAVTSAAPVLPTTSRVGQGARADGSGR